MSSYVWQQVFADDFDRTESGGWGGSWVSTLAAGQQSVAGGRGVVASGASAVSALRLPDIPPDFDLRMRVGLDAAPAPGVDVYTGVASGTWVCPAGVTEAVVECWGSGGTSDSGVNFSRAGSGGGAYARSTLTVTPGAPYAVVAPASPASAAGGSRTAKTSFGGTLVVAEGGAVGTTGGERGRASESVGDVVYGGGDGGGRASTTGPGGGGGGAAGPTGAGGAGVNGSFTSAAGAGNPPGGNGGNGATVAGPGFSGQTPGGGAGGRMDALTGTPARGGDGRVRVTYTHAAPSFTLGYRRQASADDEYRVVLGIDGGGDVGVALYAVAGGTATLLDEAAAVITGYTGASLPHLRIQAEDDRHRVKLWAGGDSEPGAWTIDETDATWPGGT